MAKEVSEQPNATPSSLEKATAAILHADAYPPVGVRPELGGSKMAMSDPEKLTRCIGQAPTSFGPDFMKWRQNALDCHANIYGTKS